MCFKNCKFENYFGDCTKSKYPEGWICPPDAVECNGCNEIVNQSDVEDGLCQECQEFGALKIELDKTIVHLKNLQKKHRVETGIDYVMPLYMSTPEHLKGVA